MPAERSRWAAEMRHACRRSDRAVRGLDAGEGTQELHLPVALGAGDADDLAAAHGEVDRTEAAAAQLVDLSTHLALLDATDSREGGVERAADHHRHDVGLGHRRGLERALADAVAEEP